MIIIIIILIRSTYCTPRTFSSPKTEVMYSPHSTLQSVSELIDSHIKSPKPRERERGWGPSANYSDCRWTDKSRPFLADVSQKQCMDACMRGRKKAGGGSRRVQSLRFRSKWEMEMEMEMEMGGQFSSSSLIPN